MQNGANALIEVCDVCGQELKKGQNMGKKKSNDALCHADCLYPAVNLVEENGQGYTLFKETNFSCGVAKFKRYYWWQAPSGDTSQPFFTKKGAREAMKNNTLEWAD